MKVEKLSENKIRITLTVEELENRDISLRDIEKDSNLAKDLFIDLIEESNLEDDFEFDNSQLFIEASSDNNNLFIVTITKVDNIPELKKYSLIEKNMNNSLKKVSNKKRKNNTSPKVSQTAKRKDDLANYVVDSSIYLFHNMDTLLELCDVMKKERLFLGKNSLYRYQNEYFIIFSPSAIHNKRFLKTYIFLSEYCDNYYSYDIYSTLIEEKAELILSNNALQKLIKI